MANARLAWINLADSAALAASDDDAAYPVANLQSPRASKVCRSTGLADELSPFTVECVLVDAALVSCVALAGVNGSTGASWRVRTWLDSGMSSLVYSTGWQSLPAGHVVVAWLDAALAEAVSIDLADEGNPAGYIEVSRLYVADYLEIERDADFGGVLRWVEGAAFQRAASGAALAESRAPLRELAFALPELVLSERAKVFEMLRLGKRQDVLVALHPEHADSALEADYTLIGRLADGSALQEVGFERWSAGLVVRGWAPVRDVRAMISTGSAAAAGGVEAAALSLAVVAATAAASGNAAASAPSTNPPTLWSATDKSPTVNVNNGSGVRIANNDDSSNAGTYTGAVRSTAYKTSGKWVVELRSNFPSSGNFLGFAPSSASVLESGSYWTEMYCYDVQSGTAFGIGGTSSPANNPTSGQRFLLCLDLDAGTIKTYWDGAFKDTLFSGVAGPLALVAGFYKATATNNTVSANFGAAAFTNSVPAGYLKWDA